MRTPPASAAARSSDTPRDKLLDAAADLFCRHGINAVGIEAVLERAGTAKSTLYKTFGSKEALVEAVLEREGREWRAWFIGALDRGSASPRERLDRVVPLLARWFRSDRFYGCLFINAVGEHDKADDRMRNHALAHKRAVIGRIEALLREAGAARPATLSHQVGLVIDGAIVAALVSRNPRVGRAAAAALTCILDANLPDHFGTRRKRRARPNHTASQQVA